MPIGVSPLLEQGRGCHAGGLPPRRGGTTTLPHASLVQVGALDKGGIRRLHDAIPMRPSLADCRPRILTPCNGEVALETNHCHSTISAQHG